MIYHGDALEYVKETPDILRSILENREEIFADAKSFLSGMEMKDLYLVGLGSSFYGAVAAAASLEYLLGVQVYPVRPYELREKAFLLTEDSLVLGISQQGTSRGVIEAMDEMQDRGIPVIAVTGEYKTEITHHGDAVFYIECGDEDAGATTKGYTATLWTLLLFGLELAGWSGRISAVKYQRRLQNFNCMIDRMKEISEIYKPETEAVSQVLADSTDLVIIAGDAYANLLPEIVLKFSETCRFPVRGFQTEDFMHGMYNAVNAETDFLFLGMESEEVKKLYIYYERLGNRVVSLKTSAAKEAWNERDADIAVIKPLMTLPLLQSIIVQTSRKRGIDLNIPRDPNFHKKMNSKIEL